LQLDWARVLATLDSGSGGVRLLQAWQLLGVLALNDNELEQRRGELTIVQ
jgi:hypothetical protein